MRIGITEQGDAGLNLSWYDKLKSGKYDGAILITKNANLRFINKVMDLYESGFTNIILHIGCTGYGGTPTEPNVPEYTFQLNAIKTLLDKNFPASHIVLRIDPIIPTDTGLIRPKMVLNEFTAMNTGITRVRISLLDEYKHVKERIKKQNHTPFYTGFYPDQTMMSHAASMLSHYPSLEFESCAEDKFVQFANLPNLHTQGCISRKELEIFGLPYEPMLENMQHRNGCHCLSCKTELLNERKQCPHKCIYCYWRDES